MRISHLVFAFTLLASGLNAFGSKTNEEEIKKENFFNLPPELQEKVLKYIPKEALIFAFLRSPQFIDLEGNKLLQSYIQALPRLSLNILSVLGNLPLITKDEIANLSPLKDRAREVFFSYSKNDKFRDKHPEYYWVQKPSGVPKFHDEHNKDGWRCYDLTSIANALERIIEAGNLNADAKIKAMNELMPADLTNLKIKDVHPIIPALIDFIVWSHRLNKVRSQVVSQVMNQVKAQVCHRFFYSQLGVQVWDRVEDQVWRQVDRQFWGEVGPQVGHQFWAEVGAEVYVQANDIAWLQMYEVHQISEQIRNQIGEQAWVTASGLSLTKASDFSEENIATKLLPALRPIIHYAYLINQLLINQLKHFRIPADNSINTDFPPDKVTALQAFIQGRLNQLPDDDTNFPIRRELKKMLSHFHD